MTQVIYKLYLDCHLIDIRQLQKDLFLPEKDIYNNILRIDFLYGLLELTYNGCCKIHITRYISHCPDNIDTIAQNIIKILRPYLGLISSHIDASLSTENLNANCQIPKHKREHLHNQLTLNPEVDVNHFGESNFERSIDKTFRPQCRMKYCLKNKFTLTLETKGHITILARNYNELVAVLVLIKVAKL